MDPCVSLGALGSTAKMGLDVQETDWGEHPCRIKRREEK